MFGKKIRWGVRIIVVLIMNLMVVGIVSAQDNIILTVTDVDTLTFPYVDAYVSVVSAQGDPIRGLTENNFTFAEENQIIADYQLTSVQNVRQPLSFIIALDTSPSMNQAGAKGTKLQDCIEAINYFIASLEAHDEVGLVTFGGGAEVLQELTTDRSAVTSKLGTVETKDKTYVYDGAMKSLELLDGLDSRPVLVLLTDAADSSYGEATFEDVIEEAHQLNIPIYPIGFGNVRKSEFDAYAYETGGVAFENQDTSNLKQSFSRVLQTLREQYLIRFTSSIPVDDQVHNFSAKLVYTGLELDDSKEFIASLGVPPVAVEIVAPDRINELAVDTKIVAEINGILPLVSVEFFVDGRRIGGIQDGLGGEKEDGQYVTTQEVLWSEVQESGVGGHKIQVVGTDIEGRTGEESITIKVRPMVRFESPNPGEILQGQTDVVLDIAPGFIPQKIVLIAEQKGQEYSVGEIAPDAGTYSYNWRVTGFENGDYILIAEVQDDRGKSYQNSVKVNIAQSGGNNKSADGLFLVVLIAGLVIILGVLLPLALRRRKKAGSKNLREEGGGILVELEGKNPGDEWALSMAEIKLGRKGDANDIPLQGLGASRFMAVIHNTEGGYILYSLNPGNPVFVNEEPIARQYTLQAGDILRLGDSVFRFDEKPA